MINNPLFITEYELPIERGEFRFIHNRKVTFSGAYEINEKAWLKIKIPRSLGAKRVSMNIYDDNNNDIASYQLKYNDNTPSFDLYDIKIPIDMLGVGLYFFSIEIHGISGALYALKDGNSLSFARHKESLFQLSVSDFKYDSPDLYLGGIIYHVFVDRFNRGGNVPKKKGSIYVNDWDSPIPEIPEYPGAPLKNNYFYGGTLIGIINKLEYLKSLGVSIIYLSPIFDSPSNHKYDTGDYMRVDASFGGERALVDLIKKAKRFGIYIILDGVFNHTGDDSVYFNRYGNYNSLGAYQSLNSPYYEWYDFKNHPDDYTSWWGIKILPRINPDIEKCRDFFVGNGGVIEKYTKIGIAGFRLDVVDELSDSFVSSIKAKMNEYNKNSLLYGEVWEDASNKISYGARKRYYLGTELDGVMNYPLRVGIIEFLRSGKTEKLRYALLDVIQNAPKRIRDMQMNILGTHDTERIITALGGESSLGKTNAYLSKTKMSGEEYELSKKRLACAYTILATLPGIPSIYYGDEAGVEGYGDPFNRLAFPWNKEDEEILDFYKKIGKIRIGHKVYGCGEFSLLHLSSEVLVFSRYSKNSVYLTVINNSKDEIIVEISAPSRALISGKQDLLYKISSYTPEIIKTSRNATLKF